MGCSSLFSPVHILFCQQVPYCTLSSFKASLSFSSWEGNILLILVEGRKKHRNPLICLLWRSCALHQILLPSELKLFGARDNKLIEPRGNDIIMNESFLLCRQLHHIKNDRCLIPVFLQECAFDDFCRMS